MKTTLFVILFFFFSGAQAGRREAIDYIFNGSKKRNVECEYHLTGNLGKRAKAVARLELLDQAFLFQALSDDLEDFALDKLEIRKLLAKKNRENLILSVNRSEDAMRALTFQIQLFSNGHLENVHSGGFQDELPFLWNEIWVSEKDFYREHTILVQRNPLPNSVVPLWETPMGYVTKSDTDGARRFISAIHYPGEEPIDLEVGLDVPCDQIDKYVASNWHQDNIAKFIVASSGRYCRIPILTFSRPPSPDPRDSPPDPESPIGNFLTPDTE